LFGAHPNRSLEANRRFDAVSECLVEGQQPVFEIDGTNQIVSTLYQGGKIGFRLIRRSRVSLESGSVPLHYPEARNLSSRISEHGNTVFAGIGFAGLPPQERLTPPRFGGRSSVGQGLPIELSYGLTEQFVRGTTRQCSKRSIRKRDISVRVGGRNSKRKCFGGSENDGRSTRQPGQHLATL
jgi:hypothetical protein